MIMQSTKCPNCGTIPEEWIQENGRWVEPPPYVTRVTRCTGCIAIDEEKKQAAQYDEEMVGVYIGLTENNG